MGWSVTQLVHRYVTLEEACLLALLVVDVWGLRAPQRPVHVRIDF